MQKWFVDVSFGYAGCHSRDVIEAEYEYTGFLDVFVEPYDAEKHEGMY